MLPLKIKDDKESVEMMTKSIYYLIDGKANYTQAYTSQLWSKNAKGKTI